MIINCWGARGSIPVSGPSFLKYGGDTTCIEIRTTDDTVIIIDAGTGIRRLGNHLLREKKYRYHLLFTHIHLDHIIGFPFFNPVYVDKSHINIYSSNYIKQSVKSALSSIMTPPYFPLYFDKIKAKLTFHEIYDDTFNIGSTVITPIQINHPEGGIGFKIKEGKKCFVFLTDNELGEANGKGNSFQSYRDFAEQADLLMHDAEFTPEEYRTKKYWGHSSYLDALQLALEAKVQRFGLFHHFQERTDAQIDSLVQKCKKIIVRKQLSMDCFAVSTGFKIKL